MKLKKGLFILFTLLFVQCQLWPWMHPEKVDVSFSRKMYLINDTVSDLTVEYLWNKRTSLNDVREFLEGIVDSDINVAPGDTYSWVWEYKKLTEKIGDTIYISGNTMRSRINPPDTIKVSYEDNDPELIFAFPVNLEYYLVNERLLDGTIMSDTVIISGSGSELTYAIAPEYVD